MLSFRTQNRLAQLIQAIAEGEKKTEVVRQVLAEQKSFEPHTAFRRIDVNRDGYISQAELLDFLAENNVVSTSREGLHVFSQLDFNDDGLISYNDFVQTLLPQEDSKLRTLATLRESYFLAPGKALPYEVEWGITRIFEQEIKNFRNIENLREVLQSSYDFNTLDCFNNIDQELLGFIDFQSINIFTRSCNKVLSDEEILAFIRAVGSQDTGRINYTQFAQALSPDRPIATRGLSRALDLSRSLERSRALELSRSLERSRAIQQEIINESRVQELRRSIERESLRKSIERESIIRSAERETLRRSIERETIRRSLEREQRVSELERSRALEQSRLQLELERSIALAELEEKQRLEEIQRQVERDQRLRELERSRIVQEIEQQELELKIRTEQKLRDLERSRVIQEIEEQQKYNNYIDTKSRSMRKYDSPARSTYSSPSRKQNLENSRSANKPSPMKGNEEDILVNALKDTVQIDRDIEDIKKQLSLRADFNLLDAFRIFDTKARGYCTKLEFQASLNDIGIFPTQDDLYLYFKRLDKDQDGLLRYSEFCKAILPFSTEYSSLMNNRQPTYLENNEGINNFDYETRFILKKLINKQIQSESDAEALRQKLSRRPLFSIHDAFSAIDSDENGFITIDEFKKILNDNGFFVSSTDLVSLVDRYDKNQDGKVSYGEFLSEMTPKSPSKLY